MNIHVVTVQDCQRAHCMTFVHFIQNSYNVIAVDLVTSLLMNIHVSIQRSTNATDRNHCEQELNNAVQCWNEQGCKRDENTLFLPFFENLDRRQLERGFETYY